MNKCVFCDEEFSKVKNSREHILRRKNRGLFGSKDTKTRVIQATKSDHEHSIKYRIFSSSPFEQTVSGICDKCNNGWMNDIDNDFEKLQYRLVKNLSVFSGEMELHRIRLWAYKTALVRTLQDKGMEHSIPYKHFHALYKDRDLGGDISVWLFNSHNPTDTYTRHTWGGISSFEYHQVTIAIGSMALYIYLSNIAIPWEVKNAIETNIQQVTKGNAIRIWPQGNNFVWPTSTNGLSSDDISKIATTYEQAFHQSNLTSSLMSHCYSTNYFHNK